LRGGGGRRGKSLYSGYNVLDEVQFANEFGYVWAQEIHAKCQKGTWKTTNLAELTLPLLYIH